MTTPDTTTVRAWARENGFTTGDRGRLPATVLDAYAKAHSGAKKGAAAGRATGAAKKGTGTKRATAKAVATKAEPASGGSGNDRVAVLERQLADLSSRLDAVEGAAAKAAPAAAKPARKSTRQR